MYSGCVTSKTTNKFQVCALICRMRIGGKVRHQSTMLQRSTHIVRRNIREEKVASSSFFFYFCCVVLQEGWSESILKLRLTPHPDDGCSRGVNERSMSDMTIVRWGQCIINRAYIFPELYSRGRHEMLIIFPRNHTKASTMTMRVESSGGGRASWSECIKLLS